jgi:hypothetical protein
VRSSACFHVEKVHIEVVEQPIPGTISVALDRPRLLALRRVSALLDREGVDYAIIGAVAIELLTQQTRAAQETEIALRAYTEIPVQALLAAGFSTMSESDEDRRWLAPVEASSGMRSSIRFAANEVGLLWALARARRMACGDFFLRVVRPEDLALLELVEAGRHSPIASAG